MVLICSVLQTVDTFHDPLCRMISCLMKKSESEHTGIKKANKTGGQPDLLTRSVTFEPGDANSLQLIPLGGGGGGGTCDDNPDLGSGSRNNKKSSSSNKLAYVFKNVYHSMRNILSKSQSFTSSGRKTPNTHVISGKNNEILLILFCMCVHIETNLGVIKIWRGNTLIVKSEPHPFSPPLWAEKYHT